MTKLSRLQSPVAVRNALDEFAQVGQTEFLERHGYKIARDYLVRNPATGAWCDSKAIAGVAYGYQFPAEGPLVASEFSGGEATVGKTLRRLGFEVKRVGHDWSDGEISSTVASYMQMLRREAVQEPYVKTEYNKALREELTERTKGAVEMKHQNISAVLNDLGLPFILGYKPLGNVQLRLRQEVQEYVLTNSGSFGSIIDALEEARLPGERMYEGALVDPPILESAPTDTTWSSQRLPRKIDYASRDERNRTLGRAGEEWVIGFEQQRLIAEDLGSLFSRVDWVSDRLGDGTGYDILSVEDVNQSRYIEVKTTNGPHATPFIISRNELEFSAETGDLFHLYRVFAFRESPRVFILNGDVSKQMHLKAIDYRASFRKLVR